MVTCVVLSVILISCGAGGGGAGQIRCGSAAGQGGTGLYDYKRCALCIRVAALGWGYQARRNYRNYLGVPSRPLPGVVVPDQQLPDVTQRAALERELVRLAGGKGLWVAIAQHHPPGAGHIPHDVNVDLGLRPCARQLRRDHRHQVCGAHGPWVVPHSGQQPLQPGAALHNTDPVVAVKVPDL